LLPQQGAAQRLVIAGPMVPGVAQVDEDGEGEGIVLELLQQLAPWLEGFELSYEAINIPRMEQMLGEGREMCFAGILMTAERDRIGHAVPFVATPPLQMVVRERSLGDLPLHDGAVELEAVLANPALRGVLADKRPYPGPLQARLMAALNAGQLKRQGGGSAGTGQTLLLMVSHGRADYTFEYPSIIVGMTEDRLLKEPLYSLSIEGYEDLQEAAIYCPRTPWGQDVAQRLDQAVVRMAAHPDPVLAAYARWLPGPVYLRYRDKFARGLQARAGRGEPSGN
jgi:uncharacterized protein (TIGR02285 family)